jgi:SAM-dependent methyltransferase
VSEPNLDYFTGKLMFASPRRMKHVYDAGLVPHRDRFKGVRVLDLACNVGFWSHVALAFGAAHVTQVDYHAETLQKAKDNVMALGARESQITQIKADVRDAVKAMQKEDFDIVLCMGILYHFVDPVSFLWDVAAMEPKAIYIDTSVSFRSEPVLEYIIESAGSPENASGIKYNFPGRTVVAVPSEALIWKMLIEFGYNPITPNLAPPYVTGFSPNGANKRLLQWYERDPMPRYHTWQKNPGGKTDWVLTQ